MTANSSILHTFSGRFFEVVVWRGGEPNSYDALIRSKPGSGVTVFKGVIECSAQQLRDLEKLTRLAQMLIQHLEAGLAFASWTDCPSDN